MNATMRSVGAPQAPAPIPDYELLDSGAEEKLERWGNIVLARPDPQVLWEKRLPASRWNAADATYIRTGEKGGWRASTALPDEWPIRIGGLTMTVRPTSFKHTGVFPEQLPQWEWAAKLIAGAGRPISVLNLFGYTGGATLSAAAAGASVCHVDGSKKAVEWARANAARSGLTDKPVRWIVDDAMTFLKREIARGRRYDAIILDPPSFGHGPRDELWKIERDFLPLIKLCRELLSETPLFIIANGYASGYAPLAFAQALQPHVDSLGGVIEYGELAINETGSGRTLPAGIFARWSAA